MGITEISERELFTSSPGEEPYLLLLGNLDFHITCKNRGLNREEGRQRREASCGQGLGDSDLTWRSTGNHSV